MTDRGLRDPPEDPQKDLENDPSLNTQETTVTTSTTAEAQTPDPAPGLNKGHQEVETIGPGSTDTDAQSENPNETDCGKYLKDTEGENSQSFQGGEQGHQQPSESLSEDPVDPEPKCSPSDEVGKTDAHVVGSSAALPEHSSDGPGASQEPPVVDPLDAQSPGHSSAGLESQHTLRKRLLAPEAERHQETQELEENIEKNAQDTIRRTDKKDFLSYAQLGSTLVHPWSWVTRLKAMDMAAEGSTWLTKRMMVSGPLPSFRTFCNIPISESYTCVRFLTTRKFCLC